MMLPLTHGKFTEINASDWSRVIQHKWRLEIRRHKQYARATIAGRGIYLHRFLLSPPGNKKVDHRDGDGLNNRRHNLRVCTNAQNCQSHTQKYRGGKTTSRYWGVSWFKRDKCWRAYITLHGRQKHLGYFYSEVAAARAYNNAALQYFREFASLNAV